MSSASFIGVNYLSIGQLHLMPIGFKIETNIVPIDENHYWDCTQKQQGLPDTVCLINNKTC